MPENDNGHRKELLDFIVRNPKLVLPWIFEFYAFDAAWIDANLSHIDWNRLSTNTNMTWTDELVLKYQDRWNIEHLCGNPSLPWTYELIKAIKRPLHRLKLSYNSGLPWSPSFLMEFKDKWHYPYLMLNPSIPWTEELLLEVGLKDQSLKIANGPDLWNTSFMDRHAHELDWASLTYNANIHWNEERISRYERYFKPFKQKSSELSISPWKGISSNSNVPWSSEFIEQFKKRLLFRPYGLHWKTLSINASLPWNEENLLERYEKEWHWSSIGLNEGIQWSEAQFEKYHALLPWEETASSLNNVSRNEHLPWAPSFIHRYIDKWNWWFLSRNEGIDLTPEILQEFKPFLVERQVLLNKRAPWSMNYILENEPAIQEAWTCANDEFKRFIWDTFFAPCVDDQFLNDLFEALTNPFRYRSMVNEEELDALQFSIVQIGDDLAQMDSSAHLFTHDTRSIDAFRDILQQTLYKIAHAPERESRIKHTSLKEAFEKLGESEKKIVRTYIDHVYELLTILMNMTSNYRLTRTIFFRHRTDSEAYLQSLKDGNRIQPNLAYYTTYIKDFGHRSLEMTSLLVTLEELEQAPPKPSRKRSRTSPF
jgi:hypothetical protein